MLFTSHAPRPAALTSVAAVMVDSSPVAASRVVSSQPAPDGSAETDVREVLSAMSPPAEVTAPRRAWV